MKAHLVDPFQIVLRLAFRSVDEEAAARREQRSDVCFIIRKELHHVTRRSLELATALPLAHRDIGEQDSILRRACRWRENRARK